MMRITKALLPARVTLSLIACCGLASASSILFSGTQGTLAAQALFDNTSSNFTLTLTNLGTTPTANDSEILTGVFFKLSDGTTLTPVSASLGAGSSLVQTFGHTYTDNDLGANWGYTSGLGQYLGPYGGGNQSVRSAGLTVLPGGDAGNFCTGAGCGVNLDGMAWGLVSPSFTAGAGNPGMDNKGPFVNNSVVLTFSPIAPNVTVSNVFFQYGTTLGAGFSETPEPSGLVLGGIGFALLGAGRFLRRRNARAR